MASDFLTSLAKSKAQKIDQQFGPNAYGGTKFLTSSTPAGAQAPASPSRDWSFFEQERGSSSARSEAGTASPKLGSIRFPSINKTASGNIRTSTLDRYAEKAAYDDNIQGLKSRLATLQEEKSRLEAGLALDMVAPVQNEIEQIQRILRYDGKEYDDNFFGQFGASYAQGRLSQDEAYGWNAYLGNPTPETKQYAENISSALREFQIRNKDALDEDAVLPAISQDLAGYLPQFVDQTKARVAGGAAGAAAGALIPVVGIPNGIRAGAIAGSSIDMYNLTRGYAFKALVDEGVDVDTARSLAGDEAFLSSILEAGDTMMDMATLGVNGIIKNAAKGSLKGFAKKGAEAAASVAGNKLKQILEKHGVRLIGGYLANVAGEAAQEGAQQVVSIANRDRGVSGDGSGIPDLFFRSIGTGADILTGKNPDGLDEVADAAAQGAKIAAMMGGATILGTQAVNRALGTIASSPEAVEDTVQTPDPEPAASASLEQTQADAREAAILRILEENGVTGTPANRQAQGVAALIDGGELSSHRADEIRKSRAAQAAYTQITGETIDTTGRPAEVRARIKQMALDKAAERNAQNVVETIPTQATIDNTAQEAIESPVTPVISMGTVDTNQAETSPVIQYTPSPASDLDTISQRVSNINLVDRMAQDSQVLGEAGRAAAMTRYDGTTDPSGYYAGFMQAYNDGMNGKRNRQNSVLTKEQYNQAYNAGRTDSRAGLTREGAGLVRNASAVKLRDAGTIDALAKKLGVTVVAEESIFSPDGRKSGANGYIKGREIHIALDANDPSMVVFKHEVTHYLQEQSAESYQAFRDYAVQAMGENEVRRVQDLYRSRNVDLTWDEAMDEVAANYTENLLTDEEAVRRLIRDDRNLAQKILDAIRGLVQKVTGQEGAKLRQAEKLWTEMFREIAGQEQADRGTMEVRYSVQNLTPEERSAILSYKSSESYKVNAKLREGIALTDMEQAMVDELDRALEKLPKVQGTVYRTLNFDDVLSPQEEYEDFIANHQAGFLVAYKAYTSASTKTDGYPLADGTKYGVTLEITSRSARDLAGLGNNFESEALFPRRTVFDITRVTTDKSGHIRIYMEEVEIYGGNKHQGHDTQKRGMAVRDLQKAHPAHTDLRDVPRTDTRGDHVRGQNLQESGTEGTSEQEVTRFSLKQENQRLQELNQYLREEISDPSVVRTSRNGVKKLASRLVSEYDSTVDKSDISAQLLSLYDFIANGKDASGNELTWTEVSRRAKEIAQDILSGAVAQGNPLYEEYADVRAYVKKQAIVVPKDSRGDFEQFGGWGEFRKRNAGRMKLMNDGLPSDVFYQELSSQWPELFPEDIANPADQMIHTAEVLQYLDAVYENPYQQEMDVYTRYLADEILESFYEVPQRTTYAQRQQLRQTKQAIRYEKRIDSLRQRQKERIADLRAQGRDRIKQAVSEQREESAKKLDALKRKYQGKEAATRDRREAAATRAKIQRHVKKLSHLLTSNSDKAHVPDALKKPVAALLEAINLESQYTVDPKTGKRKKNGGGDPTKRTQAFQELRTAYAKIMESGEYLVDPDLQDNLDAVIRMKNKRLVEMNQAELETVWKAVSAMEASIRSANKLLAHSKFESISGIADSLRRENSSKPEKRNYVRPIGLLDGLLNLDMMTPETFFHRLGDPGDAIFRMMRNAADDQTRTLKEAEDYTKDLLDGMKARDLEKELHTFRIDGQDVELSTAQIMELYVLSRRQQAVKHLYMGGIRPTGARKGVLELGAAKPVHVTPQDVANIISTLTDDQILVAEGMQSFLSEEMAEKGNRASMKVYGYKKFSEENYWPIRVDNNQTVTDVAKETAEKMVPQYGMTKQVTPGANNALFIGSIFDSYAKHITEMSIYSAWLATWEDVNRIHNFQFRNSEGARTGTVKEIVSKVFGKNGNGYITNLLRDVSQGTKANADTVFSIRGLTSAYKAASVGANLRVILQQPTAALRALDLIDPKYFLAGMAKKGNWDRVKKWAPIAQWKDWGYFEMDTGRAIKDVLLGTDSVLERVKQATMWAAGKADSVTWARLWNACEAEIADKRPGLKKGSDEFYRAVADRFNQVIDQTQVVDSVLTRTQIMRSSSDLNKMAASFMSEPSKVYNMMLRSVYDLRAASDPAARSAARKRVGRTSFTLVASFAANAIAQSLVDAARDDDREKKYLERFVAAYEKNFIANFNPAGYVPYLRDIVSIIQGYDVSRMDMDSISKAINSATNAYKALSGGGKKTVKAAFADLFAEFSRLLGVPVSNIKRDVQSVIMTTAIETENYRLQYEIDRALLNLNYAGNTALFMDTLYGAMKTNRADYEFIYSDLVKNGMDPAKIASGMESRMKADQGVTSISDLEQRYLPPDKEKEYQSLLSGVSGTKIWAGATEEQRKNASDDIYQLIMGTDRSASLRDKISAGSQYGLTEEEMVLYELAKEVASQDGNDNTSQEEAAAAAAMLPGLSDNERAYLWQSTNKGWKDTNNPWK